jgi:hypothetical protein
MARNAGKPPSPSPTYLRAMAKRLSLVESFAMPAIVADRSAKTMSHMCSPSSGGVCTGAAVVVGGGWEG